MTAANIDQTDLSNQPYGGLIREDVMEKIWQIDGFPLPLTDMCSKTTSGSQYKEFTIDELGASATDNAVVDGADIDQNDAVLGTRVGNYHQTAVKEIQISTRANAVNSIGRQGTLSYQVAQGQKRLRRDVESQMCTQQASVAGNGTSVAGISAGLGAWIATNALRGATGTSGGFNTTTGLIDAPGAGTPAPLTEQGIRDIAQAVYEAGGNTEYLMSTPTVIRIISEYLFSDAARVATMTNDNASGTSPMTAYGSANVFITDFGQVLKLKDNRLQKEDAAGSASLYFLDPSHLYQSFITGYRTEPLAKTGLSEKRLISCDYSLLVTNEKSQGVIADIDTTAPMTAVPA
jgi:hypothetical protein